MSVAPDWHESDQFWELVEPVMFDDARLLMAGGEIEGVLALALPAPHASVLDLCCGPGRHSIELAKHGLAVTGVDRTRFYLDKAAARGGDLPIEWILADAREFVRPEAFDLVVNLFTSFGYFESRADDHRVAENIFASLKPGGKLVMTLVGKETVGQSFNERTWEVRGDWLVLDERRIANGFETIENHWTMIKGERQENVQFAVRLYAASEIRALLTGAGFSQVKIYGSLTREPYDHLARRMVVLATK